jgi:ArsR family transcriptional regulator
MDDQKFMRVLKALADGGRFRMVQEIAASGELSCGQVGERFDVTQPTISHHSKILADAEVLLVRREGQHGLISVNHNILEEVAGLLPQRRRARSRALPRPRRQKEAAVARS